MFSKSHCARVIAAALLLVTTTQVAHAGFVSTERAHAVVERQVLLSGVEEKLAQDNVRVAFERLGVSASEVNARIGALTDAELAQVNAELDQLPAGGDLLAVIGIVFVVLIILQLVGAINLFNKGALNFGSGSASSTASKDQGHADAAAAGAGSL